MGSNHRCHPNSVGKGGGRFLVVKSILIRMFNVYLGRYLNSSQNVLIKMCHLIRETYVVLVNVDSGGKIYYRI